MLIVLVSVWVAEIYEEDGESPVKNALQLFLRTPNLEYVSDLCSFFVTLPHGDELEEMEKNAKSTFTVSYPTEMSARDNEPESAMLHDEGRLDEDVMNGPHLRYLRALARS